MFTFVVLNLSHSSLDTVKWYARLSKSWSRHADENAVDADVGFQERNPPFSTPETVAIRRNVHSTGPMPLIRPSPSVGEEKLAMEIQRELEKRHRIFPLIW